MFVYTGAHSFLYWCFESMWVSIMPVHKPLNQHTGSKIYCAIYPIPLAFGMATHYAYSWTDGRVELVMITS